MHNTSRRIKNKSTRLKTTITKQTKLTKRTLSTKLKSKLKSTPTTSIFNITTTTPITFSSHQFSTNDIDPELDFEPIDGLFETTKTSQSTPPHMKSNPIKAVITKNKEPAIDPLAHATIAPKRQSKKKHEAQQEKLAGDLFGQFINVNDQGDDLVWAGNVDQQQNGQTNQDQTSLETIQPELSLHEQILQLYLDNYQQQETLELQASFDKKDLEKGREVFIQQLVNALTPKEYARFVHSFRTCIQRLRVALAKHQGAKTHLQHNVHVYADANKQKSILSQTYNTQVQEIQISFFRQAAKIFGDHSDVFMSQLVIYLSSLTLTQLESHRERQHSSQMNLYSCGFWDENPHNTAFRDQFKDFLDHTNPTLTTSQPQPDSSLVPLSQYTFPVRLANKLYATIDIHTDSTNPLFQNQLARIHAKSHKVFVSNIPSTLTTRELMALFGNCGVLNAAEIFRDKLDERSGETISLSTSTPSDQNDESLAVGLSISRREALIQANTAAMTIDIADIALGHFTSSFKTDQLLVPSHVVDGKVLQSTIDKHKNDGKLLLDSQGKPMDAMDSIFADSSDTFLDSVKENFNAELQRFETAQHKRINKQSKRKKKMAKNDENNNQDDNNNDGQDDEQDDEQSRHMEQQKTPSQQAIDQLNGFNFKMGKNGLEKFHLKGQHSPVYGYLYFATPEGKKRALKQALQVFGLSTASGYAMTTQDASTKTQLIVSGLHRSMTGADVAHFIRSTLGQHMSLTKPLPQESTVPTNAFDMNVINQQHDQYKKHDNLTKVSIIDRIYVPRSYARTMGSHDYFNENRGYAIISFDSHESAFHAFRYLQNTTVQFARHDNNHNNNNDIEAINPTFNMDEIEASFTPQSSTANTMDKTTNISNTSSRVLSVHWKKEKPKKQRMPHPITSYFPTLQRPKQKLFHNVSQQLKAALPHTVGELDVQVFGQKS